MGQPFDRLKTALADRYAIERELGRGGYGHGPVEDALRPRSSRVSDDCSDLVR